VVERSERVRLLQPEECVVTGAHPGGHVVGGLASGLVHDPDGPVTEPRREAANYVPTRMGARYDALLWLEETNALRPLHHEGPPSEPELETEPSGF